MDNGAGSYRRFLDGDESGLADIIREYRDGLILYLNNLTGNISLSEELAEDTFVKLGTKKPKDKGKGSFKAWLYTIGRNVAIDHIRRGSKHDKMSLDDCAELTDDENDLERLYIREENKITVHRALRRLKPDYRVVLYLIFFEGFQNAEAADVMHKSKRQIENLIYQAKLSLKSELNKEGFVYEEL